MEFLDQKGGLDFTFRQNVLNNEIIKKLKECAHNTENPFVLSKLNDIAVRLEEKMYNEATSKGDYLAKVQKKLSIAAKAKFFDAPATPTAGNQLINTTIQGQSVHTSYAQQDLSSSFSLQQSLNVLPNDPLVLQPPMSTSLTMQQRNKTGQPDLNQLKRDHRLGHQNALSSVQQSLSMKEQNHKLSIENRQQPSQSSSPFNFVVDARLQGTCMPNTSFCPQTLIGKNKHSPQSQMTSTKAPSAFASLPDPEYINSADWKLLIDQYQRARSRYLPELVKLQKRAEEQCFQGQNVKQLESAQRARVVIQQMIKFLHVPESELIRISKETLYQSLNKIIQYFNSLSKKGTIFAGNQAPQSSYGQIRLNNVQTTLSVNTPLICKPVISSQMTETGSSLSQPSALNSPLYSSLHATKRVDVETVLHQGPVGTADRNTHLLQHLNVKHTPQLNQSSSVNQPLEILPSRKPQNLPENKTDFMNSMFPPLTKATSRTSGQQSPGACVTAAKLPQRFSAQIEQKENASLVLDPRSMSQPKPMLFTVDPPSITMAQSSAAKDIGKPAKSVSSVKSGAGKAQSETEVRDMSLELERPEVLTFSLPSDSSGAESNKLSHCAKRPFERLIQAVQLMSKEALRSSMDDIASAMNAVDKLPTYANDVDSELAIDENLTKFSKTKYYYSIGDEYTPHRKMKRDIYSVIGVMSTLDNHGSCTKKPRNEVKDILMDEIREINQRLIETVIEVDFESDSSKETIIKCTYKPVHCSEYSKGSFANMESLATMSIEFLVPSFYPNFPPKILDKLPVGCCKETTILMEKAKSRFDLCVRGLVSLREMVQAWDDSARSVFSEFALCLGGETFSAKYGTWECVPAA